MEWEEFVEGAGGKEEERSKDEEDDDEAREGARTY